MLYNIKILNPTIREQIDLSLASGMSTRQIAEKYLPDRPIGTAKRIVDVCRRQIWQGKP